MNLANSLTAIRIVLAPIITILLLLSRPFGAYWAAGLFAAASLTDFLDGAVARKRQEVTPFGKSFDPLADKVLIVCTLLPLSHIGKIPWLFAGVIIGREVMVTVLRAMVSKRGGPTAASWFGKAKTVSQIAAILWVLLSRNQLLNFIAVGVAVVFTVLSGIHYLCVWLPIIAGRKLQQ